MPDVALDVLSDVLLDVLLDVALDAALDGLVVATTGPGLLPRSGGRLSGGRLSGGVACANPANSTSRHPHCFTSVPSP
jgi:hypothetical protein